MIFPRSKNAQVDRSEEVSAWSVCLVEPRTEVSLAHFSYSCKCQPFSGLNSRCALTKDSYIRLLLWSTEKIQRRFIDSTVERVPVVRAFLFSSMSNKLCRTTKILFICFFFYFVKIISLKNIARARERKNKIEFNLQLKTRLMSRLIKSNDNVVIRFFIVQPHLSRPYLSASHWENNRWGGQETRVIIVTTSEHTRIVCKHICSSPSFDNSSIRRRFTSRGTLSGTCARPIITFGMLRILIPFTTISAAFVHTDSSGRIARLQNSAAKHMRDVTHATTTEFQARSNAQRRAQIAQSQQVSDQGGWLKEEKYITYTIATYTHTYVHTVLRAYSLECAFNFVRLSYYTRVRLYIFKTFLWITPFRPYRDEM